MMDFESDTKEYSFCRSSSAASLSLFILESWPSRNISGRSASSTHPYCLRTCNEGRKHFHPHGRSTYPIKWIMYTVDRVAWW